MGNIASGEGGGTRQRLPLSQFGLGFWQAWWTLAFCTGTLVGPESASILDVDVQTLLLAITTLGYFVPMLTCGRRRGESFGRATRPCAAGLCCAGSLGMASATYLLPGASATSTAVFLASSLLFSVGNALLISLWGELWGALACGAVGRCLYASYIIAYGAYFILQPLPLPARVIVLAAMPVISCCVLSFSQSEPKRTPRKTAAAQPLTRKATFRALSAAFLLNLVWGAGLPCLSALGTGGAEQTGSAGIMVALALLICMFIYMYARKPEVEAFSLYSPIEVSLAGGMLLAMLLPASSSFLGEGMAVFGGACLDALIMLVATDVAFRTKKPAAFVLSLAMLVARLGSLVGRISYDLLIVPGAMSAEQMLLACAILVLVGASLVFTRSTLEGFYRTAPTTQNSKVFDAGCDVFASTHGLTAREAEVLALLVKGRSAPYIAERLSIALGTAKNHMSSIYRKAGVGDRQSLLNLIEQESAASDHTA